MRTIPLRRPLASPLWLSLAAVLAASLAPIAVPRVAAADVPPVATERLTSADRYAGAVEISKRLYPDGGARVVYLVSGAATPDALSVGPLAAREGGVVMFTEPAALPSNVATELGRLKPARAVVVGSTSLVSAAVFDRVRSILGTSATVERIYGVDRYDTAAKLATRSFGTATSPVVFVASGSDSATAVGAGVAAARVGAPLLLTQATTLPSQTAAAIKKLHPGKVELIGNTAVVSATVATAIQALGTTVDRLGSDDAYKTANALSNRYPPTAKTIIVANATNLQSALAVAPLAKSLGAPVLFTQTDAVPTTTRDALIRIRATRAVLTAPTSQLSEIVRGEVVGWSGGLLAVPPSHLTYPSYDSNYHDYYEMQTYIRAAEIARPDLVHVFSIGKSYQGRDIWAAKVSDNVGVDEAEPEVLVDALHHAREHLGVEQALYLLRTLVSDYGSDATVKRLVDSREVYIVFALNPDGWIYDLTGSGYRGWRKNRQPTPGSTAIGTDINRNYGYKWGCCGGSSTSPAAWNYRGTAAFSTTEARVLRDFVNSRVIGGVQQIRTHVTLHTNGEYVLWPYSYTKTALPADMTADDHATFVAMGKAMAALNGYTAKQSSNMYITDGDEIDWLYHDQKIFSFTWELYPVETPTSPNDFDPPDEVIPAQTARNRSALLYLIDLAGCPQAAIGKQAQYCAAVAKR